MTNQLEQLLDAEYAAWLRATEAQRSTAQMSFRRCWEMAFQRGWELAQTQVRVTSEYYSACCNEPIVAGGVYEARWERCGKCGEQI
jgi:hypothetical protein